MSILTNILATPLRCGIPGCSKIAASFESIAPEPVPDRAPYQIADTLLWTSCATLAYHKMRRK